MVYGNYYGAVYGGGFGGCGGGCGRRSCSGGCRRRRSCSSSSSSRSSSSSSSSCHGRRGRRGIRGNRGERGPIGAKGEMGQNGDKGQKGDEGQKGEVGAQGEQGDKGDKGERGEKGEAGVHVKVSCNDISPQYSIPLVPTPVPGDVVVLQTIENSFHVCGRVTLPADCSPLQTQPQLIIKCDGIENVPCDAKVKCFSGQYSVCFRVENTNDGQGVSNSGIVLDVEFCGDQLVVTIANNFNPVVFGTNPSYKPDRLCFDILGKFKKHSHHHK